MSDSRTGARNISMKNRVVLERMQVLKAIHKRRVRAMRSQLNKLPMTEEFGQQNKVVFNYNQSRK